MENAITPIFILSLPRSGSTLLQTILATHHEVDTTPEPWFLLPIFYSLRSKGIYTEYNHSMANKAIKEFCSFLPEGKADYYEAINSFGLTLYKKLSQDSQYFLDKTPRYHVISEEIIEAFPEGRFIILFRNPLSILASILSTWKPIHLYRFDLYKGLESLLRTAENFSEKFFLLHFEKLVDNPTYELRRLCEYLDIKFHEDMVTYLNEDIVPRGKYGNPSRHYSSQKNNYKEISKEPIEKWKDTLSQNRIKKFWGRRYLRWIGEERVNQMGYDFSKISKELEDLTPGWSKSGEDLLRIFRGLLSIIVEPEIIRQKLKKLPSTKEILPHQ